MSGNPSIMLVLLCVLAGPICIRAQQPKAHWQRVYTGDGTVIEINAASVRFQPDHILRAEFRTVFSKAESAGGASEVKYKIRLETVDFRLIDRRYRFFEIALLDTTGKLIQKRTADDSDYWRVPKAGGITERLFNAACLSTPLGAWKVVAYRFADGDPKRAQATPEPDRLIGVGVDLHFDRAEVANKVCSAPLYEDRDPAQEQLVRELGIDWKAIGVNAASARVINVRCEGSGWEPPRSLLIKDNREEMLMLWEGVFLVLKRTSATEFHNSPTLKRSSPQRAGGR